MQTYIQKYILTSTQLHLGLHTLYSTTLHSIKSRYKLTLGLLFRNRGCWFWISSCGSNCEWSADIRSGWKSVLVESELEKADGYVGSGLRLFITYLLAVSDGFYGA